MAQKVKRIIFEFTDYVVIYIPLQRVKFQKAPFRVIVYNHNGKALYHYQSVSHFPNKTNALKLALNKY